MSHGLEESATVIEPTSLKGFVETPYVRDLTSRALTYLRAGFPVHFRGPSGTGKTTLALYVASKIGRPAILIHGDEEYSTSSLVGGEYGYHTRKVIDRFVSRVVKVEEDMVPRWVDHRLTVACRYGFTLVYDEFSRSRPEANNVLLPLLQEGVIALPIGRRQHAGYLKVDPRFAAIFTSNPEEYAGVHRTQDALRDRMVTIDLDHFDEATEIGIVRAKSGLSRHRAHQIVRVVRAVRESGNCEVLPTVRGAIMIAKTLALLDGRARGSRAVFAQVCQDILGSESSRAGGRANRAKVRELVTRCIEELS